ncbi:aminopeptidase P family protein [Oecophyllibacter saccharovorans]|uniref:aminopeptidase P family protein n=1 Tax=Oecophyllibacter saccharovorans TaxID=2558360 RepID=UPI001171721F|nr:aminopeptidase P family protein [Oecophyllibacter saccharovorans]TPW34681.1 aminopeptidase P family protein [Oecophyllibacter saccharovorans]
MPSSSLPLRERPVAVRKALRDQSLDGFILPRGDGYLGEYVAPSDERLAWLTGFTGSAGLAIVLEDKACVFSDGRYTAQMEEQVPHDLWERRHITLDPPQQWLGDHAVGKRIGYDPRLVSSDQLAAWQPREQAPEDQTRFVAVEMNPVDLVWQDRPTPPASIVTPQPLELAGETSADKRQKIARELRNAGQAAMILADCTSIAWLFNLRGQDLEMLPVAQGYALLMADGKAALFIDPARLSQGGEWLEEGIEVYPPQELKKHLHAFTGQKVRLDPATTPAWFVEQLEASGVTPVLAPDLCTLPKALKNPVELEGHRKAQALDGIAMARFLSWLTQHGIGKSETALAAQLNDFRRAAPECVGLSFETISGVGPNGASPHYRAEAGKDRVLTPNSVYLVDSGGQYHFGTTDITRTVWLGEAGAQPPQHVRNAFTRVLKGHIALARARFPAGTPGYRLDTLARAALWEAGLDYDHGTGHGIGSYLSVHEGPQSISPAPRPIALQAGMILSNEPAYYEPGAFGIRIENLLLVRESDVKGPRGPFLEFETLSYTPIDRQLIDTALLTPQERHWVDTYHAETWQRVSPHLEGEERQWLETACAPL